MDRALKILNASSGLYLFAAGLFAPLYAVFIQEIGGGTVVAGTAYSIYAIAAGLLIFMVSRWEDRHDHKDRLVIAGYVLATAAFAGYYFVQEPAHMFAVQALLGVSVAVRTPAFDGLYSMHLDPGKEASEWGTWESMYWIVTGISAFVGGYVVSVAGFRVLFLLMAGLSGAGTVTALLLRGTD